jgi:fatty-acyl-CoA synthase
MRQFESEEELVPVDVDEAVAVLLFTSGTTGTPKPVRFRHHHLTTMILETVAPPDGTPRGCTLLAVPTYHVAGLS